MDVFVYNIKRKVGVHVDPIRYMCIVGSYSAVQLYRCSTYSLYMYIHVSADAFEQNWPTDRTASVPVWIVRMIRCTNQMQGMTVF